MPTTTTFLYKWILFLNAVFLLLTTYSSQTWGPSLDDSDIIRIPEVDVSWDFEGNDASNSGWGNATTAQMEMVVSVSNGELRCSILGYYPKIESPDMFVTTTPRHYVTLRARYSGAAVSAQWLIRTGNSPSPIQQSLLNMDSWGSTMKVQIIDGTGFRAPENYNFHAMVDMNPYTFLSINHSSAFFVFDLGQYRWINSLQILPYGNQASPKDCVLQYSMTTGVGPFQTVSSFTLLETYEVAGAMQPQVIRGFSGYARYWRLLVLNNHGYPNLIQIREFDLKGYDDTVNVIPFDIDNSGEYKIYYLPIYDYLSGVILKMRMELIYSNRYAASNAAKGSTTFRDGLAIDFVRIVRAPEIWRVRGCLDKYYSNSNLLDPQYNVTTVVDFINNHLPIRSFIKNELSLQYATTYDCPSTGGVNLTIDGINFGPHVNVFVGGQPCPVLSAVYSATSGRQQSVVCTLPRQTASMGSNPVSVRVQNAIIPGLFYESPSLEFRMAPAVPLPPTVTNIGAHRVDLTWAPPNVSELMQMTVTGYKILWFQPLFRSMVSNLTVGNVTTTSIRGLQPATEYVFAIAAISEGSESANKPTDLYGRREVDESDPNTFVSEFSVYTNITGTLRHDFDFSFFNANATLNSSGSSSSASNGPTGQFGSEGQYGLVIVGSANIENCNVSSTCCDGFNASIGISSCGQSLSVCVVFASRMLAYDYVVDGITRRGVPSNLPYSNGAPPEINIMTINELILNKGASLPSIACGPSLRLTPSDARESGSAWYRRKVNVREGFDTTITFQISNPSQKCDRLDDVNTYCRSRGADGMAFVIQNAAPDALGLAGSGLGYEGIFNALSVELDTYHNFENMDYYENHVSVLTQGYRFNISANHSYSLATTNRVPDLTDGIHTVRVKYDPNFDENAVPHPSFQANGFASYFFSNADFSNGGEGDWGTGVGLLYVYLDDMYAPVITTPLNLAATLQLDDGRAFVGLTAATGDEYWQAHDVLGWQFDSLFEDEAYTPPVRINGQGAYQCVNLTNCVHPEDYSHYMRTNHVWGKGQGSTEGWQTGTEGFCAFC